MEHDYAQENYGDLPLIQSQSRPNEKRTEIYSLSAEMDGQDVIMRARIHTTRAQGAKMVFMNLRQRADTVQVLLAQNKETISKPMVKWVEHLPIEAIVLVYGTVKKSPEHIKSATIGDVEVHVKRVSFDPCIFFWFWDNDFETDIPCLRTNRPPTVLGRGCQPSRLRF
jgi:aspartyl-tRNA synthetase